MIFISHNSKDKKIVEPIAIRLADVFGSENVFYDSWSMQPGDGLIDKMDLGLGETTHFFYFVSENSLQSKMVKLEWQNALSLQLKGKLKFIPVRLTLCEMPPILDQTFYIDFYSNGLEVSIKQIVDVVNGVNTFEGLNKEFTNVEGLLEINSDGLVITLSAIHCLEPRSSYAVLTLCDKGDLELNLETSDMIRTGYTKDAFEINGTMYNAFVLKMERPLSPGFPDRIKVKINDNSKKLEECVSGIMYECKENEYKRMNVKVINNCRL